jgi:soluble lytic murein transglycosylase-like protein
MDVRTIFYEKLNNIQSRVPVKIWNSNQPNFQTILDENISTINEQSTKINKSSSNSSTKLLEYIDSVIKETSIKYDMDYNLVKSIVKAESDFNYTAKSNAGAMGLMQLMPETAESLGVENPYDIEENIDGGTRYFKEMLNKFNGDLDLALAAYNAGPNAVINYNGIPPYKETINYIKNVKNYYNSL